ncbi:RNA methyltransferase [Derxia gummosa]|uniref:tRNA (cytidine/uridine-2'-O-)-methyltransferase TrmJ n=1 Tax=Derxia gummosa DSM 723 TaxID=1121388 RepID=A0A8B6X9Z9_9BURK|nr:RNA methyltransferase [Derxia gummosa]
MNLQASAPDGASGGVSAVSSASPVSAASAGDSDDAIRRARACFVLVNPSHPGNVGSAARAMKTMGFGMTDGVLRVVVPRFGGPLAQEESIAFASSAIDVLEAARVYDSLDAAVADCSLVYGLSARTRDFAPPQLDVRDACVEAVGELAAPATRVAFVFGTERTGLSKEQLQRCDRFTQIDADPEYSSLNVAQALQIVAYELRRAFGVIGTRALDEERPDYASHEEVERFMEHLYEACVAVEFIQPAHPKKLFERLRRLFARTRLEREEVQLLRGLCKQMIVRSIRR